MVVRSISSRPVNPPKFTATMSAIGEELNVAVTPAPSMIIAVFAMFNSLLLWRCWCYRVISNKIKRQSLSYCRRFAAYHFKFGCVISARVSAGINRIASHLNAVGNIQPGYYEILDCHGLGIRFRININLPGFFLDIQSCANRILYGVGNFGNDQIRFDCILERFIGINVGNVFDYGGRTVFGYNIGTGTGNVCLGFMAGRYATGSNELYIDNQDRTNTAGDVAGALLYGTFSATPASQTLLSNAQFSAKSVRGLAVTFANVPATPIEGMLVAVTDSTTAIWGATITGSGANHVLAYYNGSAWTVAGK